MLYLSREGIVFVQNDNRLFPACSGDLPEQGRAVAEKLSKDPYSSFFKTPFLEVAYGVDGRLHGVFSMTPGDFSPGSPFDAFHAVREFTRTGDLCLPRIYLYPTSECNSQCPLCQFHSRHEERTSLSLDSIKDVLRIFRASSGGVRTRTLIISGDGEPTLLPYLPEVLEDAKESGCRVFLTTNLRKPYIKNKTLFEALAKTCAMITVSIKGLSPEAYAKHQGVKALEEFERVMENLAILSDLRRKYETNQIYTGISNEATHGFLPFCAQKTRGHKYRSEEGCLLGVASLFLPENTPHYRAMIDRLHALDIDYFYLNQVEPSLAHWGISFTEQERTQTLRQLSEYAQTPFKNMIVRHAADPFRQSHGDTVYYDASKQRIHPDICGSALFNPLVLSKGGSAVWSACRTSEHFYAPAFEYKTDKDKILPDSIGKVMTAAAGCRNCRLERQVKHFDRIIDLERTYRSEALDYYLVFDTDRILDNASSLIAFESVVK